VLYLLEPTLALLQDPDSGSAALEAAREDDFDLTDLEWQTSARQSDHGIRRLALIYGYPCRRGIVIDAHLILELDRGAYLTRTYREVDHVRARTRPHQDAVDKWLGTTKAAAHLRRAQDRRVAEQHAEDVTRAEARAAKRLSGDLDPALVQHWTSLGGPSL
jgi:hypothetical protein